MSDTNNQYEGHEESALRIPPSSAPAFERHFSVRELAVLWGLSEENHPSHVRKRAWSGRIDTE
jgi:hypothetical protein